MGYRRFGPISEPRFTFCDFWRAVKRHWRYIQSRAER